MKAALYLRSSKDRSDVSIDAQRFELRKMADNRALLIVQEFSDTVESGSDTDRPGFQKLIGALSDPSRGWDHLLLLDTSRLARRRHIAVLFEHDAEKHGITILYKNVPDTDPITGMLLKSILQAMDEWHSLTSRQKGLAGMAENVRQGYRAGGRAPKGYQLKKVPTGAIREGEAVEKSVLEPSNDAPMVARYLKARAAGERRTDVLTRLGLDWKQTFLIGMEWNALTYAGHTVWGVHQEFVAGRGYTGGNRRRPRAEWTVQKNTHPALITDGEAEVILSRLEGSRRRGNGNGENGNYLLSMLLKTPDGAPWHGDCGRYRLRRQGKSRAVEARALEQAVLTQLQADLLSPAFLNELLGETRKIARKQTADPTAALKRQVEAVTQKISRTMDLASDLADPHPALRKIDELERQRRQLMEGLEHLQRERQTTEAMAGITEEQIRNVLAEIIDQLSERGSKALNTLLHAILDQVTLDPETHECRLHYRIGIKGVQLASPRVNELVPLLRAVSRVDY